MSMVPFVRSLLLPLLCGFAACSVSSPATPPAGPQTMYLGAAAPGQQAVVFKAGTVSREGIEFGMAIHPGTGDFYFTRLNGSYKGTIYVSRKSAGGWSAPEPAPFSGVYHDTDPFITRDGASLYFASTRPLPDSGGASIPHIWKASKTAEGWSEPHPVLFAPASSIGETSPTLTAGGTLYFFAHMPALGAEGLYRARANLTGFQQPEFCTALVNSGGVVEVEPFIDPGERFVLYYSAGRADNAAPFGTTGDIYCAVRKTESTWSAPVNIGSTVNSSGEESHPVLSPDGTFLFFARNVGREKGFVDIFWIEASVLTSLLPQ